MVGGINEIIPVKRIVLNKDLKTFEVAILLDVVDILACIH